MGILGEEEIVLGHGFGGLKGLKSSRVQGFKAARSRGLRVSGFQRVSEGFRGFEGFEGFEEFKAARSRVQGFAFKGFRVQGCAFKGSRVRV